MHSLDMRPPQTVPEPFSVRVKRAAEDGIVAGVRYGVALLLICLALMFTVGDYYVTRNKANAAVQWIQQQIDAAQKAQRPAQPEAPSK